MEPVQQKPVVGLNLDKNYKQKLVMLLLLNAKKVIISNFHYFNLKSFLKLIFFVFVSQKIYFNISMKNGLAILKINSAIFRLKT